MSSIYLNGEWWYYQTILTEPNGKKKKVQRSLKTKDKKEGRKRQKEYDDLYLRQQIHLVHRTGFNEKIEEYKTYRRTLVERGELTQNTLRADDGSLKVFTSFFEDEGYKYLNEFEDRDRSTQILQRFIDVRRSNKVSPNTIRHNLRHLSGFFTYCVSTPRRLLPFNPVSEVSLPKPVRQTKFPNQKDWVKLRQHLRDRVETSKPTLVEMVVWVQIETGCRIGEVFRLKWDREPTDVVGVGEPWSVVENYFQQIRIYSKRRERVVPIKELCSGRLSKFLRLRSREVSSKYVFPSPRTGNTLNISQFSRSFKKLLKSLKISKTFGTHGVRHGFISYLLNNGVSSDQIGWFVGHSSSEITKIYSHPDLDTQSKVVGGLG